MDRGCRHLIKIDWLAIKIQRVSVAAAVAVLFRASAILFLKALSFFPGRWLCLRRSRIGKPVDLSSKTDPADPNVSPKGCARESQFAAMRSAPLYSMRARQIDH